MWQFFLFKNIPILPKMAYNALLCRHLYLTKLEYIFHYLKNQMQCIILNMFLLKYSNTNSQQHFRIYSNQYSAHKIKVFLTGLNDNNCSTKLSGPRRRLRDSRGNEFARIDVCIITILLFNHNRPLFRTLRRVRNTR